MGDAPTGDAPPQDPTPKRPNRRHSGAGSRNTGWYIPFWRKPKRSQPDQAPPERGERRRKQRPPRIEHDPERVLRDWIGRYNAQLRALRALGLGMGTPKEDIKARYDALRAVLQDDSAGADRLRELRQAYDVLRPDS